jgi:hypothetical protein
MREFAALLNAPIIYCLTYNEESHRIGGLWAHEWLVDFIRTADDVAFHPYALQLIKSKLSTWKNPLSQVDDYTTFLNEASYGANLDDLISKAIENDAILEFDKTLQWQWKLNYSSE